MRTGLTQMRGVSFERAAISSGLLGGVDELTSFARSLSRTVLVALHAQAY